ncbi:hypothetical protein LTR67_008918 [Exophiala xenobiotica]
MPEDHIQKLIAALHAYEASTTPNPEDSVPFDMRQARLLQTTNPVPIETHHDSEDSRYREVANDDFEDEWWEICSHSGSGSGSGSDPDSAADSSEEGNDDDYELWSISAAEKIYQEEGVLMPFARPQLSLHANGHLLRYAIINWQIDCIEARERRDFEEQWIRRIEHCENVPPKMNKEDGDFRTGGKRN